MIIEDNELEILERLESPKNLVNRLQIKIKHEGQGKNPGDVNIPDLIKEVAIEAKALGGTNAEIGSALGTSTDTITKTVKGLVANRHDEKLQKKVDEVKGEVENKKLTAHDKALDHLLESFDIVKEEMAPVVAIEGGPGIRNLKRIKQATSIAKDLAAISGSLTGKDVGINVDKLVIVAPNQKHISQYNTIVVGGAIESPA